MLLSGTYGFNVVAAPQFKLGHRSRHSLPRVGLLPRGHGQAGDIQNVTSIPSPGLWHCPSGWGGNRTRTYAHLAEEEMSEALGRGRGADGILLSPTESTAVHQQDLGSGAKEEKRQNNR